MSDDEAGEAADDANLPPKRRGLRTAAKWTGLTVLGLFLLIQLVPYGWRHPNPPVTQDAPWPDAESAAIARRSCYDCHSNESRWPAYTYVAPMSWLTRFDVERGREKLNFSEWDRDQDKAEDAAEQVSEGRMPLSRFTLIHRDARLSDDEVAKLTTALGQMSQDDRGGGDNRGPGGDGGGDD
ncbi:MAG TPA: heme-binding domain-containing protein [Acidimicrobiales bacterium]|nr:heme-binding domain-containing protein [Acidimicrobiales bacterium]